MPEWTPHPGPQKAFLASGADECLFGGAAGGGKTLALLMGAVRHRHMPRYRAILFRRTFPELEMSLIDYSRRFFPQLGAFYNEEKRTWTFPSGAQILFGSLPHEKSVHKYQSAEFAYIGFDELTSFTEYQYEYLLSRNRNTVGLRNVVRAATNPGNIGHHWCKKRFVDTLSPYEPGWFLKRGEDELAVPSGTEGARSRQFIPARVWDNPTLIRTDPGYLDRLNALPERERLMLLEGRWDVAFKGLVYDNFDATLHVVDSFPIPAEWARFRAIDFGYNNPFVCLWGALSPDDELFVYRELYETERLVADLGPEIRRMSEGERIERTVADHDAENRAELNRCGIPTIPARKTIQEGIHEVYRRLNPDERGKPRLRFFRDALVRPDRRLLAEGKPTRAVEEFGVYRYPASAEGQTEKEIPLDLDNHGMDALRYLVMHLKNRRSYAVRWRSIEGI